MNECAYLSVANGFTVFQTEQQTLRFKAPYSLQKYVSVQEWDHGYLVVKAKYSHNQDAEEEYIDLIPILMDLCQDADAFLSPIKKVEVLDHV